MTRFFTRERFGRPQFLAAVLLLIFLAQAVWLLHSELHAPESAGPVGVSAAEQVRLAAGWRQIHGGGIAGAPFPDASGSLPLEVSRDDAGFDTEHSPLLSLVTAAPLLAWPQALAGGSESSPPGRWLPRIPFLAFGVFLGASLWYVSVTSLRKQLPADSCALTLYCFSPAVLQATAVWHVEPEILAAWGCFGAIFTAIAVAHTLYAPREVVLWNWRRILLLGISLAIAVGSQFSMIVVVPIALAFLLYLAPIRRGAALAIWGAASLVALFLLFATYASSMPTHFLRESSTPRSGGRPGAASPYLRCIGGSGRSCCEPVPHSLCCFQPRSQYIRRGLAPAISATPRRCCWGFSSSDSA